MKCSYCGNEIAMDNVVELNGLYFCNTLHRYSWNAAIKKATPLAGGEAMHVQQQPSLPTVGSSTLRITLFGILYAVVFFFLQSFVFGGIVGGIAGVEAGAAGRDASEAGRIAGEQFGAKYGWIMMLIAIIVATIGSLKCWLPGTRKKKAA